MAWVTHVVLDAPAILARGQVTNVLRYKLSRYTAVLLILLLLGCEWMGASKPMFAMERFRAPPYHAVTTQYAPQGVTKISATQLKQRLKNDNIILMDVFGAIFREESLYFDGAWLLSEPRQNIPSSVWLANVGKQTLSPLLEDYFRSQLQRLTAGNKERVLVFYCIEDCWMSWNAAKRAHAWGYNKVLWFREGVDGWLEQGGHLQNSVPVKLPVIEKSR